MADDEEQGPRETTAEIGETVPASSVELVPPPVVSMTPVEERLCERAIEILDGDPKEVLYQHTVLCQTYFPYRDPKTVRRWARTNGRVSLLVQAGEIIDPRTGQFQEVGLPFGPKSRLIFAHLNRRALQVGSNVIPLEEGSFTAFVRSMQDPLHDTSAAPNGREVRAFKDQLKRLSVARFTLATRVDDNHAIQQSPQIIDRLEVTFYSDERQRHLWPETITLSPAYWESLQKHAVPLDARALAALSHSALAIDIYQWLAQRLHRIPAGKELLLPRLLLHQQFGEGYDRERKFWEKFKEALRQVVSQYQHARLHVSEDGLHLQHSLPPVPRRFHVVHSLPGSEDNEPK